MLTPLARVILIGGVSGAGKSTFATRLAAAHPGHSLVRLDWLYDALVATRGKHPRRTMQRLAPALLGEIIAAGGAAIVEGGWIEPRAWAALASGREDVRAIYFGYPAIGVRELRDRLGATEHWLGVPGTARRRLLRRQIEHSRELQRRVARLPNARFVDVSPGFA